MTALVASRRTGHLRTVPVANVEHLGAEWFIVCRDTDVPAPSRRKRRRARRARIAATTETNVNELNDRQLKQRTRELIAEAEALEARIREDLRKRGWL